MNLLSYKYANLENIELSIIKWAISIWKYKYRTVIVH